MINLALDRAARCAGEVLADIGISTLPVDPFAIAQYHEIDCEVGDLQSCSGCLILRNETFRIIYHDEWGDGFARFTVAHELGHYFIEGHPQALFPNNSGEHRSESGYSSNDRIEREADDFAANLLMPPELFSLALSRQTKRGLPAIEALAELCVTSLSATAIRYAKLCDVPVAIVLSSRKRVNWCFMSDSLQEICHNWLRKGSMVPPASATYAFNKHNSNVTSGERLEYFSYLDAWFDDAPSIEMREDIVGLGRSGKTLTVLFLDAVPVNSEEDW